MSAGGLCMHGSMPSECVRCADRIVINELRAERDALLKLLREVACLPANADGYCVGTGLKARIDDALKDKP